MRKAKKNINSELRNLVFRLYGHRCAVCGSHESLECDHVHPECLGGRASRANLQCLCHYCNNVKNGTSGLPKVLPFVDSTYRKYDLRQEWKTICGTERRKMIATKEQAIVAALPHVGGQTFNTRLNRLAKQFSVPRSTVERILKEAMPFGVSSII